MSVEYYWIKENVLAIGPYPNLKDLVDITKLGFKAVINFVTNEHPLKKYSRDPA